MTHGARRAAAALIVGALVACDAREGAPSSAGPDAPLTMTPAAGVEANLAVEFTEAELRAVLTHSPMPPVPPDPTNAYADDPAAAHFGRWLFFDPRLSHDGSVACATCHDPARSFTDGERLSIGLERLRRHAPSIVNVGYNRWFYWDGRRDTLWSQAAVPIETPKEMGFDRVRLTRLLASDDDLRAAYESIFGALPDVSDRRRFPDHARPIPKGEDHPHGFAEGSDSANLPEHDHSDDPQQRAWDGMTEADREAVSRVLANVGKALAAYQRTVVSAPAPFDTFVAGLRDGDVDKLAALDAEAQAGLQVFVGRGNCTLCHSGPLFTDREFHNALVPLDAELGEDPGRFAGIADVMNAQFAATGPYSDDPNAPDADKIEYLIDPSGRPPHDSFAQFKTPSLRGVTTTAPYMHRGQLADLEAVLEHYSSHKDAPPVRGHVERFFKPVDFSPDERAALVAFLASLEAPLADDIVSSAPTSPLP